MIQRFISARFLLCVLFITSLFIRPSLQQCPHPSNYSDFTLLLIDNRLVVTGSNLNQLEVWTQDISSGLDILNDCWTNNTETIATNEFLPYKNGIGFQYSNTSIAVQAGDQGSSVMSNMAIFDLNTTEWFNPAAIIQGQQPEVRARMSVSLNSTTNIAWFYGGRTESSQNYFNSFYYFDIGSNTWYWPEVSYSGGYRPARYGHSSSLISERLFIIGGKTMAHNENDSWVITTAGDFQSVLVFDTTTYRSISMATIGDIPPARFSFSAVNAPDGKSIVLFGGQNATETSSFDAKNDIYVLDTCTLNWSQPIISGIPPIARAGHEAIKFMNQYMIITMGIQNFSPETGPIYIDDTAILDMKTWTWIDHIPRHHRPSKPNKLVSCRFTFPFVNPDEDGGNQPDSFTPSVLSNNTDSNVKKLALGITFGILGFLILATAGVIFILRIRRDVDPNKNPRWLPNVLLKKRKASANTA
ncbi:hypothetical protein BDF21DRAFT_416637 [Thamnidium elegans]|nr:hypothetical protein BDF21DRAFT_416637 [Thamnidium elegans]